MANFTQPPRGSGSGSGSGSTSSVSSASALPGGDPMTVLVEINRRQLMLIEAIGLMLAEAYEVPGGFDQYVQAVIDNTRGS